MQRVLTIGTFDIPHIGHAALLRRCEQYGVVLVGVNSDRFVQEYKGRAPLYSEGERMLLIQRSLGYETYLNDGPGIDLIKRLQPDVLVIGGDWLTRDYLSQIGMTKRYFDQSGISMVYVPYTKGISTTAIELRVRSVA